MSDLLRAAIRAHTEPTGWIRKPPPARNWVPPEEESVLVVDTETTTDQAQGLLVGCYCVAHVHWDRSRPNIVVLEEGLIRPDDEAGWTPSQQRLLSRYVANHAPKVDVTALKPGAPIPGRAELRIVTSHEFVWQILLPAIEGGVTLVAWNAPFDCSRLAERAYASEDSYRGGITLELAHYQTKDGRRKPKISVRESERLRAAFSWISARLPDTESTNIGSPAASSTCRR